MFSLQENHVTRSVAHFPRHIKSSYCVFLAAMLLQSWLNIKRWKVFFKNPSDPWNIIMALWSWTIRALSTWCKIKSKTYPCRLIDFHPAVLSQCFHLKAKVHKQALVMLDCSITICEHQIAQRNPWRNLDTSCQIHLSFYIQIRCKTAINESIYLPLKTFFIDTVCDRLCTDSLSIWMMSLSF